MGTLEEFVVFRININLSDKNEFNTGIVYGERLRDGFVYGFLLDDNALFVTKAEAEQRLKELRGEIK